MRPCYENGMQKYPCPGFEFCDDPATVCKINNKKTKEKNMKHGTFYHKPTEVKACQFYYTNECFEVLRQMGMHPNFRPLREEKGIKKYQLVDGVTNPIILEGSYIVIMPNKAITFMTKDRFEYLYEEKK